MTKDRYAKLLNRPEWRACRWEILKRDKYSCRDCSKTITTGKGLHVHHTYYDGDKNPWDYPKDSLVTLCAKCHDKVHGRNSDSESITISAKTNKLLNLSASDLKLYVVLAELSPVKLPNPVRKEIGRKIKMSLPTMQKSLAGLRSKGLVCYDSTVWSVV